MSFKINNYKDVEETTPLAEIEQSYDRVVAGFQAAKLRTIEARLDQLRNLYYAVVDNRELLAEATRLDFGRNPNETNLIDLDPALADVQHTIDHAEQWAKNDKVSLPLKFAVAKATIRKDPHGTVLIISPWNYPYMLALPGLASAIAAGNTVLYKPSEVIPHTSRALTKVLRQALDPDVFQVVLGAIPETTKLLELHFDLIFYTGSGRVGKIVAAAAAKHLTPTVLELGGKSPVFVTKHANVKLAATRVAWGKCANAGQTCVAPDYVLVDPEVADEFTAEVVAAVKRMYPDLRPDQPDLAHSPAQRLFERSVQLINETQGTIVYGGTYDEKTRFVSPTVVTNVGPDDALMQDELFCPILPIITLPNLDRDGVRFVVKHHDTPLCLYIFSDDAREVRDITEATRSGGVMVNDLLLYVGVSTMPFGGTGQSGYGKYHGKHGFDLFTTPRPVMEVPTWIERVLSLRYPPFSQAKTDRLRQADFGTPWYPRTGPVRKSLWRRLSTKAKLIVSLILVLLSVRFFMV